MLIFAAAAGWFAGLLYAWYVQSPPYAYAFALATLLSAILLGRRHRTTLALAVLALGAVIGALRMDVALSGPLRDIRQSGPLHLTGVIVEQPARDTYVADVRKPAEGTVLISARPGSKLRYGDLVSVRGMAVSPVNQEPYERSLARSYAADIVIRDPAIAILSTGRGSAVGEFFHHLRLELSLPLERHMPQLYAPVAEGLLLGGGTGIDTDIKSAFRSSGTSHVLAASGYNVSVFAGLLLIVLQPLLGKRTALPFALGAIAVYTGLAGLSESVIRAALMAGVAVIGMWLGRPRDSGRALVAAAFVMTLWHPQTVFDVGAQLSFAATAGLVWMYPMLVEALSGVWRLLAESTSITLTAQASTLPVGLYYFSSLPSWAVVANLIIAPLVPAAMLCSALTIGADLVWPGLGAVPGWASSALVSTIIGAVREVASLPGSKVEIDGVGLLPVILYYCVVAVALLVYHGNARWFSEGLIPALTGRRQ